MSESTQQRFVNWNMAENAQINNDIRKSWNVFLSLSPIFNFIPLCKGSPRISHVMKNKLPITAIKKQIFFERNFSVKISIKIRTDTSNSFFTTSHLAFSMFIQTKNSIKNFPLSDKFANISKIECLAINAKNEAGKKEEEVVI